MQKTIAAQVQMNLAKEKEKNVNIRFAPLTKIGRKKNSIKEIKQKRGNENIYLLKKWDFMLVRLLFASCKMFPDADRWQTIVSIVFTIRKSDNSPQIMNLRAFCVFIWLKIVHDSLDELF